MNVLEEGVLLLCCRLGDETARPLTMAQYRELGQRVSAAALTEDSLRDLTTKDLLQLGYDQIRAETIVALMNRQTQLERYLRQGAEKNIYPVTRLSCSYPSRFIRKQAQSRPTTLFTMGHTALWEQPAIAVIGSRQLQEENEAVAKAAGRLAAEEGFVLVSGGARGADIAAQRACLDAGGSCVIFAADSLEKQTPHERILYVSADGYDIPFSAGRALSRNRLIHTLGDKTIAVQCSNGKGGTWQGCVDNLKHGWSELFIFDDGSEGAAALMQRGATGFVRLDSLQNLMRDQTSLFS